MFDVIDLIAPDAATLTMKVQTSSGQPKTVTLKRKVVKVSDPVTYSSKVGKDGLRIGYIRISEFNAMVPSTLPVAINALESLNCDEYLLDLRGNPGGSFQSAIEIAGLFVQDKVAVNVVDGSGKPSVFKTADVPPLVNSEKPVAIWLDENSASASEVLSGALQDNCRVRAQANCASEARMWTRLYQSTVRTKGGVHKMSSSKSAVLLGIKGDLRFGPRSGTALSRRALSEGGRYT